MIQNLENILLDKPSLLNQKWGKHNLQYFQSPNVWKRDKCCGNQNYYYICLTNPGTLNKNLENITMNIFNLQKGRKKNTWVLYICCDHHLRATLESMTPYNLKLMLYAPVIWHQNYRAILWNGELFCSEGPHLSIRVPFLNHINGSWAHIFATYGKKLSIGKDYSYMPEHS